MLIYILLISTYYICIHTTYVVANHTFKILNRIYIYIIFARFMGLSVECYVKQS